MRYCIVISILATLQAGSAAAQGEPCQWSQFRGPNGSGVANGCRPPAALTADCLAWEANLPPGHSSPVLSDQLVILTAVQDGRLVTLAYDKTDGELAWRVPAPPVPLEKVHEASSPASSTPCVNGSRIFVYFGSYGLLCYDGQGRLLWERAIPTPKTLYGMSTSPIVDGDRLILVLDNDANMPDSKLSQSKIVAFDTETGETVWETPRPFHRSGWSTPTVWKHDGGCDLVVLGNGRLRGYEAATGLEKWFVNGFSRETIARPIIGEGVVFGSASMLGGVPDDNPDPEPFWAAVMKFDANQDGRLQRDEMTEHFTFPFRPDLPVGHPGFGFPMPKDPRRRTQILDGMFARTDKDKDGFWTKEEFLSGISFNRGKPNLMAIRPGGEGDVTDTHVVWALHRGIPEVPSPIYDRGRIYLVCDGGVFCAVNGTTGQMIYRQRLGAPGHYRSSPVVANGLLYAISEEGVVSVVATGDAFQVVHQSSLDESVAASPAIDADTIYLRTKSKLLAFRATAR